VLPCAAVNAFKPHLAGVADYPYSKFEARVKLDQNESPDDFPPELKARALERIARVSWNRYPELHAEDVRAAVARHEGWPEEGVVLSPGSNLLVLALAEAAASVVAAAKIMRADAGSASTDLGARKLRQFVLYLNTLRLAILGSVENYPEDFSVRQYTKGLVDRVVDISGELGCPS